ncbi:hypothetical protein K8I31_12690 [bacterium]|nr:hypothetical protein [bacterium]
MKYNSQSCFHFSFILLGVLLTPYTTHADTEFRIFRSSDQGNSWSHSDQGASTQIRINAFVANSNLIFAGSDNGLYLSRDQGKNWDVLFVEPTLSVRILCLESVGKTIYAGTDQGLYLSNNLGQTWRPASNQFQQYKILSLHKADNSLYIGTNRNGVWKMKAGEKDWRPITEGLPKGSQIFDLDQIGDTLFAALYGKGLYRKKIGDSLWEKVPQVTPLALAAIGNTLVAGHNPGGVYISQDLGQTWQDGSQGLPPDAPIWTLAANDTQVYAGASDGIFYSDDNGKNWQRAQQGLPKTCPGISFLASDDLILAGVIADE